MYCLIFLKVWLSPVLPFGDIGQVFPNILTSVPFLLFNPFNGIIGIDYVNELSYRWFRRMPNYGWIVPSPFCLLLRRGMGLRS